jgi:hypothetical protein
MLTDSLPLLNLENLKSTLAGLIELSDGEEQEQLRRFSKDCTPEVRGLLISIRNQALEQREGEWAALFSLFIYATSEPTFWEGAAIEPSVN